MKDEHSITSRDGSIFSKSLFLNLRYKHRSLDKLITLIGEECSSKFSQTTTINVSHPNIKLLWPWVFGGHNLIVRIDNFHNVIYIEKKKETAIVDQVEKQTLHYSDYVDNDIIRDNINGVKNYNRNQLYSISISQSISYIENTHHNNDTDYNNTTNNICIIDI